MTPTPAMDGLSKVLPAKSRVHQREGVRQLASRQMMICDDHIHACPVGAAHPINAGRAVVDGDDYVRCFCQRQIHDLRRQPVAELEPVGHQKGNLSSAHCFQQGNRQRHRSGTVRIKITDDEDALPGGHRPGEPIGSLVDLRQCTGSGQRREITVELLAAGESATQVDSLQQWRQVIRQIFQHRAFGHLTGQRSSGTRFHVTHGRCSVVTEMLDTDPSDLSHHLRQLPALPPAPES